MKFTISLATLHVVVVLFYVLCAGWKIRGVLAQRRPERVGDHVS
jgi:hypothetical protein